jgi:enamine deaminase RidA (YjgF/YER057c/UK114 family)
MQEQALQALDNLETLLRDAEFELADVVRLNVYVTDIDAWRQAVPAIMARLAHTGASYACTLLGVARLGLPQLLVEIEATAAK